MALIQANLRLRWLSFSANTFWLFCSSSRMSALCRVHLKALLSVQLTRKTLHNVFRAHNSVHTFLSPIMFFFPVRSTTGNMCLKSYTVYLAWSTTAHCKCLTLPGHRAIFSSVSFRATAYSCTSSDTTTICGRHRQTQSSCQH